MMSRCLKTGTANEDFQQEGKQDWAKHLLYSLARTGESSEERILRTIILSGPVALDASGSQIAQETILTVIFLDLCFCSV